MIGTIECKYKLPCGWCEKRNIKCEYIPAITFDSPPEITGKTFPGHLGSESCLWEWVSSSTLGNHYRCRICGATKIEPIGNSTISNSTIN